jgi:hypothetical protein
VAGESPTEKARRLAAEIHSAPAPPAIVFSRPPQMVTVPGTRVYVVDRYERPAYDYFRYGGSYYIYNDGYWYRAPRYDGPFVVVEERYVPRTIYRVPTSHWRNHPHGMPPGLAKKYRDDRVRPAEVRRTVRYVDNDRDAPPKAKGKTKAGKHKGHGD